MTMNKETFIHSFVPVLPEFHLSQEQINDWILEAHKESHSGEVGQGLQRFCLSDKYISQRYFECPDVNAEWDKHEIYTMPDGVSLLERNMFYGKKASTVFEKIYGEEVPEHVIHVTCTGYLSPSPAQRYFCKGSAPEITHAYHMGCYASLPSVRMAQGLHLSREKTIDIVHTEMCSLHLDPKAHTPEQIVVQTLFADGHIKYSVGESAEGLKILGIKEKLLPDSHEDMTWVPGAHGMRMTLSKEVPIKIRDALPEFIKELCEECGIENREILHTAWFAIHPGGPKIIEAVQKRLELREEQVRFSHKVLFERGNMSSATLPHVWNEIFHEANDGDKVLSLAFGPGLTIFGGLFEVKK